MKDSTKSILQSVSATRLLSSAMLKACIFLFALTLGSASVFGQFEGDFAFENWTWYTNSPESNGSFENSVENQTMTIHSSDSDADEDGAQQPFYEEQYVAISQCGSISFDYTFYTEDEDYDKAQYVLNGVVTLVSLNGEGSLSDIFVTEGDVFAFRVENQDNCCGNGTMVVSNFAFQAYDAAAGPEINEADMAPVVSACEVTLDVPLGNDVCFANTVMGSPNGPIVFSETGEYEVVWSFVGEEGTRTFTQSVSIDLEAEFAPVPVQETLTNLPVNCTEPNLIPPTAMDDCDGLVQGVLQEAPVFEEPGNYEVTWVFADEAGNESFTTQILEYGTESINPIPVVESLPAVVTFCSYELVPPSAVHGCEGMIAGYAYYPSVLGPGNYNVTWYYESEDGGYTTQTEAIQVIDTEAPVPTIAELPTLTVQPGYSFEENFPTAFDNCMGQVEGFTYDNLYFECAGEYEIEWMYVDYFQGGIGEELTGTSASLGGIGGGGGGGNITIQTQIIIVENDGVAPVAPAALEPASYFCSFNPEFIWDVPTAEDACEGTIYGYTESEAISEAGEYTITWIFEDFAGNASTAEQTITIEDNDAPYFYEVENITVDCDFVLETLPVAYDDCNGETVVTTDSNLNFDAEGTYTVTWNTQDAAGNTSTYDQTITIDYSLGNGPEPVQFELNTFYSACPVEAMVAPTAVDFCDGELVGVPNVDIDFQENGEYEIEWTYTDLNGNMTVQNQYVIIDTENGFAPVPELEYLEEITMNCSDIFDFVPYAMDDCDGQIAGVMYEDYSFNSPGYYYVDWVFTDLSGNTSYQGQEVEVVDEDAPAMLCAELLEMDLSSAGIALINANMFDAGISDCSDFELSIENNTFSCENIGENIITITATDDFGNTATCTSTVMINDVNAPEITTCPTDIEICAGEMELPIVFEALDFCTSAFTATFSAQGATEFENTAFIDGTMLNQGETEVTLHVTDSSGNTTSCEFNINVISAIPEVAQDNNTLSTAEGELDYQWFNCATDEAIEGATSSDFEPSQDGEYQVMTSTDNCENVSECFQFVYTGVEEIAQNIVQNLFPNPSSGLISIDFGSTNNNASATINLRNNLGQLVFAKQSQTNGIQSFDLGNLPAGLYTLQVLGDKIAETHQVLIAR